MNINELKDAIDLHDLAARLEMQKDKGGNYFSPWREEKEGSLSIQRNGKGWKDFGDKEKKGSCIDLVMHAKGKDIGEAMRFLHELYGFPIDRPDRPAAPAGKLPAHQYAWSHANCPRSL